MNRGLFASLMISLGVFAAVAILAFLYFLRPGERGDPERESSDTTPVAGAPVDAGEGSAGAPGDPSLPAGAGSTTGDDEPGPALPDHPPSITGIVSDVDGVGIPDAEVAAVDIDEWQAVLTAAESELSESGDPATAVQLLRSRYEARLDTVSRSRTDTEGRYAIHGLPGGDYRLYVRHDDHLPETGTWAVVEEGVTASADVTLVRGHAISGRVVDARGDPIADARVRAEPSSRSAGAAMGKLMGTIQSLLEGDIVIGDRSSHSGPDGEFIVRSLEPVLYDLTVRAPGFLESRVQRVAAGSEGHVIPLERGAVVTGTVVGRDGAPVDGARWTMQPKQRRDFDNPVAMMQMDFDVLGENVRRGVAENGRLRIDGLARGPFELEVREDGFPITVFEVQIAAPETDLGELALETPHAIAGTVFSPDGAAVEDARVWIEKKHPALPGVTPGPVLVETSTDESGRFVLEPIPAGRYTVNATADTFAPASVADVEVDRLDVRLQLERGLVAVARVVDAEDDSPIEGVRVSGVSPGVSKSPTSSDAGGRVVIRGLAAEPGSGHSLAPGARQSVFARFQHPEYATAFEQLSVGADDTADPKVIRLVRTRVLHGRVIDPEGEPIPRARVRLEVPGMPAFAMMLSPGGGTAAVTDAEGGFELRPPGRVIGPMFERVEIVGAHPAYASGRLALADIPEGDDVLIEIVLAPGASIAGRVTGPDGTPVAGARVHLARPVSLGGEEAMIVALLGGDGGKTVYAGKDGGYRIRGVEPGEYVLEVGAMRGFAPERIPGIQVADEPVTLDVVLRAGGVLEGRVVDGSAAVLEGIEVVAFLAADRQPADEPGGREAQLFRRLAGRGVATARTGADGRYRIENLPPGRFSVVARAEGFEPVEISSFEAGDRLPEIVLRRFGGLRLTVVAAETGRPVERYRAFVTDAVGDGEGPRAWPAYGGRVTEVEDAEGRHVWEGLAPRRVRVTVEADGFAQRVAEAEVLDGRVTDLTARLDRGLSVTVVVVDRDGVGISGVIVQAHRRDDAGSHSSIPQTDDRGVAVVSGLAAGSHSIGVQHPAYWTEESTREVELPAEVEPELRFRMEPAGQLEGTIADLTRRKPSDPWHFVVLRPIPGDSPAPAEGEGVAPPADTPMTYVSPDTGEFSKRSVRPGRYSILLLTMRPNERRVFDPERADTIELGTVEIRAGETATVQLTAPR